MATSFVCERSVELAIIPYLKLNLEKHFDCVVPMFPWISREFSKISETTHKNDRFKVMAVFSRRPKLELDSNNVFVTINNELLVFKKFAEKYSIPVIAGCPVSTNFWELSKCVEPVWIDINQTTSCEYLYPLRVGREKVCKGLTMVSIVKMIKHSHEFDYLEFREFVQASRYELSPRSFWGQQYKPIYLLIK